MPPPSASTRTPAATSPSTSLVGNLRQELMRCVPFSQMQPAHVDALLAGASQVYFAPDEVVLDPSSGPTRALLCIRQGSVTGRKGLAESAGQFEYVAGDLFPVGALLAAREVTATYTANEDTFCLRLPSDLVQHMAALSPPLADFLNRRVMHILALSRVAMQAQFAAAAQAEQAMETALARLPAREPLTCDAATPLSQALGRMHERRVGSMLVVDAAGALQGIVTRHDILGRITLPQLPLDTPIGQVMSSPVASLDTEHTLQDAALLMSRQGVRQVPVTFAGRVVNVVSQRDLFGLQRLSIKQLGSGIRAAADVAALKPLARGIGDFARNLLGQGVQARQLTELISHLNDLLTRRLVELVAQRRGADLQQACWLSFGSEGRGEQTVATDQDNGLVFLPQDAQQALESERAMWLAFALEVNEALDACGYPLCKGGVMASNPACCLSPQEWTRRFVQWVEGGTPEHLLQASIYFDLRPLCGNTALAEPMQSFIRSAPSRTPRFIKQMADNALRHGPPLNWRGALSTTEVQGQALLDLKLQGTAMFVDAARLYALAHGLPERGTRARLLSAAPLMGVATAESEAWVAGFEFLQMLRLQVQLGQRDAPADNPNTIDTLGLNDIERRMLKETLRMARSLQQRIQLDYGR
jgi:CBS domain-containing protein